jgi:hypothetical protein
MLNPEYLSYILLSRIASIFGGPSGSRDGQPRKGHTVEPEGNYQIPNLNRRVDHIATLDEMLGPPK